MALYNPYRNFDKGMDDAYMGYEPQNTRSNQYMVGYEYATELLMEEEHPQPPEEQNEINP